MIIEKYENYEIDIVMQKKRRRETCIRNFPEEGDIIISLPSSGIVISSTDRNFENPPSWLRSFLMHALICSCAVVPASQIHIVLHLIS
jgi:hypothetical protein